MSNGTAELVTFATADGETLVGDLHFKSNDEQTVPSGLAVISHPHPLRGGNRHSPVVSALFEALATAGLAVLRFDFRGVGDSTGTHGDGVAERHDVAAAIRCLTERFPDVRVLNVGYSFGSRVALGVDDATICGWICIAPPLAVAPPSTERDAIARDLRPKVLFVPERDQFSPPPATSAATSKWNSCELVVCDGADHFFNQDRAQIDRVVTQVVERVPHLLRPADAGDGV
jgi:uncharacterized protein